MDPSQILLLRVAIDLSARTGGELGPLYPDGRFEYVPILERRECTRPLLYSQIPTRCANGSVEQFVPHLHGQTAHYDPEFRTFTYGDPGKRGQLLRLRRDDILAFTAGLRPPTQRRGSRLYVVGYFTVQAVHDVATTVAPLPPPALQHLWDNAHFRRAPGVTQRPFGLVEGCPQDSRLFEKAIPLSDDNQQVLPEMQQLLGITGSVMRGARWLPSTHVANVAHWLRSIG
jgi:hypothetical protein